MPQLMRLQKPDAGAAVRRSCAAAILTGLAVLILLLIPSCTAAYKRHVVIWTDQPEFASYTELFNVSQDKVQAVVIYKENPAASLPPAKDEQPPDIVIGPWLNNSHIRTNFMPVDYLFTDRLINQAGYYQQLLRAGQSNGHQYLLPVSFNLPAVIFAEKNASFVPNSYMLTLNEIKEAGRQYNEQNKGGMYTKMGFAPRWDPDFLILAARLRGAEFQDNRGTVIWGQEKLDESAAYIKDWTISANGTTETEEDFSFKYLYTPEYKQIVSDRCLFAYMASRQLFGISPEDSKPIDFRWIHSDGIIPVEDDTVFMGLFKDSVNMAAAETFMIWFMDSANQRQMLERSKNMGLEVSRFGISGGFSSVRQVTERILPSYYPGILQNFPSAENIAEPQLLPAEWPSFKQQVLVPYLTAATDTKYESPPVSMEQLLTQWATEY